MNNKLSLLVIALLPQLLLAEVMSISVTAGSCVRLKNNLVRFSDGAYAYSGVRAMMSAQFAWRNLPHGIFPACGISFQPHTSVDSSIASASVLGPKMVLAYAGGGKTFNLGYARIDLAAYLGYNWQTYRIYRRGEFVEEHQNDICFILGTNVRSPIFDNIYTNVSCEFLFQEDTSFDGVLKIGDYFERSYTLDAYNKMLLVEFGVEVLL